MIKQALVKELAQSWSALPDAQREQVSARLVRLAQRRQQRALRSLPATSSRRQR